MNKFLHEFKLSNGDDELKTHLRSRIEKGVFHDLPTLTYTHLQTTNEFRLLTLLSGTIEDEIRCTLDTYDVTRAPKYAALSYVWGDETRMLPISCDLREAQIPTNLYSALLRVRKADKTLTLWIDALCIDQATNNNALRERASQVRMMHRIFSAAEQVIVDLGGATRAEYNVFVRNYQTLSETLLQGSLHSPPNVPDVISKWSSSTWRTWYRFFLRPWFGRVWIVQEFVLARKITILMGKATIDPMTLIVVTLAILIHFDPLKNYSRDESFGGGELFWLHERFGGQVMRAANAFACMVAFRASYQNYGVQQTLPQMLHLSRSMVATDVRDHVFALAGLVKGWNNLCIEIDYLSSEVAVRTSVARALVLTGNTFYCLSRAAGVDVSAMTWGPLLRRERDRGTETNLGSDFMGVPYSTFQAAGETTCRGEVVAGRLLAIQGIRVDTIESLAPALSQPVSNVRKTLKDYCLLTVKLAKWYSCVKKWALETDVRGDSASVRHDLWKAILYGTTKSEATISLRDNSVFVTSVASQFEMLEAFHAYVCVNQDTKNAQNFSNFYHAGIPPRDVNFDNCSRGRVCSTAQGCMANAPFKTVHGDEVWILSGIPLPVVLRNLGNNYALVGPTYVTGLMNGEALERLGTSFATMHLA